MTTSSELESIVRKSLTGLSAPRVLVALSGGKDSLALLICLERLADDGVIGGLAACHVEHGIRGDESLADARFCETFCRELGIDCHTESVDAPALAESDGRGIEDAARKLRYAALERVRSKHGFDLVATAHTADDDRETFFVRLLTGTGIAGLAGIPARRGQIIRPLLEATGEQAADYCAAHGVTPRFDAPNGDDARTWNWVRNRLLVMLESVSPGITDTVGEAARLCGLVAGELDAASSGCVKQRSTDGFIMDAEAFDRMSAGLQRHLVARELAPLFRVEARHVSEAMKACRAQNSRRITLAGGWMVERSMGVIRAFHRRSVEPFRLEKRQGIERLPLPGGRTALFSDSASAAALVLRTRKPGDRIGSKRVKDLFIDRRVTLFDRDRAVVAESADGVVWVENITLDDRILVMPTEQGREG